MQHALLVAHLIAISTYLGATILVGVLIETIGARTADAFRRRERYAVLFSAYNPLAIGALGVAVMTGAWALTPYKQELGADYFMTVGSGLVTKLALAFVVVMMATYVCFGICHRLVRAHQWSMPVTDADLDRVRRRLRVALWLTCALTVATLWVATRPGVPAVAG